MSDFRHSIIFSLFERLETSFDAMEETAKKYEETTLESERSRDKTKLKESRHETMAKKRKRLRELFEKELIEQENLLRDLGYAFIRTYP